MDENTRFVDLDIKLDLLKMKNGDKMGKTQKNQHDKFKEAAKELGCDESEERFDANLKEIAKSSDKKADTEKQKG